MLKVTIPAIEQYDEIKEEFVNSKEQVLQLEHSLVSLSKWESKWHKPFLTKDEKTFEESVDYIRCMTLTQNLGSDAYVGITNEIVRQVSIYIEAPMTATVLPESNNSVNRETITSEVIYYWMVALTIPFECQKWHLNRLLTLINVCNIKNKPPEKMSRRALMERNASLNAARKKELHTNG